MLTQLSEYESLEKCYTSREIRIARLAVGEDALRGIGYWDIYRRALHTVRVALREARR